VKTPNLKKFFTPFLVILISCLLHACTTIDLYEKTVTIPQHAWKSNFKPSFDFTIKDTTSQYRIFLVLRHNEKYSFSNIYLNLYVKGPGQDSTIRIQKDLTLATNEKGWLGSGMDDIYEHRIELAEKQSLRAGTYTFTLEEIMREDPLQNVLNAGIRLEKQP
jgi:gliding motility-associated lipoprotein GldH